MKHFYILCVILLTSFTLNAQIVDIPDYWFKNALVNTNCVDTTGNGLGDIDVDTNNDGEIQVSEAEAVIELRLFGGNIISMQGIEAFINLQVLDCNSNLITSLDVSGLSNLDKLICWDNELTSLNVSGLTNLTRLDCAPNNLTTLDVSGLTSLVYLWCYDNNLTMLDVSDLKNLTLLSCSNNNLNTLFLKNGSQLSSLSFSNNPNIEYICADDFELDDVQTRVEDYGYTNCVVNSYCSFVPGGEHFITEGQNILDFNTDGCDINDIVYSNLKFNINDGTINGTIISNTSGDYSIPVLAGTHTLTPVFENPDYFTSTPSSITVDFPTDTSPFIQDFCITPDGVHNDLEIVIIPLEIARPGFDTDYKLIYKNKGNTTLSDNIEFDYNENNALMELVSSSPNAESNVDNILTWSYTNLLPFETREILITMNLNTPTDTPPLNGGDDLGFVANIFPITGDETTSDNNFQLKQTVVNSFDPNDKTCLEGETITPDQVGKFVHYMIRFENTGTASAVNIVVKDVIDLSKYDVTTLFPLDASHDFFTRIKDDNIVEFVFEDINLPFDDANNDGYVVFKIKTLDILELGDTFSNDAEIYFDYNFPIITNDELTTVAVLSTEDFEFGNVELYPNPASNTLHIKANNNITSVEVYNLLGQQILSATPNTLTEEINMSSFNSAMYLVKVKIGEQTATYKFVKE